MKKVRTHYENLQVVETATIEVIRGAYKHLAQKWHPDKNLENRALAERNTKIINEAFAVLSDPLRRREHDEWIAEQRRTKAEPARATPETETLTPAPSPSVAQARHRQPWPPNPGELSFFRRLWLCSLLTFSLVLLLLGLYNVIFRDFKIGYIAGPLFGLYIGFNAYVALFRPGTVDDDTYREAHNFLSVGGAKYFFYATGVCIAMVFLYILITEGW